MNKRITYFDVFKGILILTVVAEHIIKVSLESVGIFQKYALVNVFTSFNMVAFFVISGYMLHYTMLHTKTPEDLLKHIYKRFIQLLIPWFVWGGVFLLYFKWLQFD